MEGTTWTDQLRRIPQSNFTSRELAPIAALLTECEVPAGSALVREDTAGRQVFILLEGTATVTKDGVTLGTVGPSEPIGEMALLDDSARAATVVADVDSTVAVLSPSEFATFLDHPGIGMWLCSVLSQRLRAADSDLTRTRRS